MEDVGLFYGLLVYFTAFWSILRPFGIFIVICCIEFSWAYLMVICYFFPVLVCCAKKNLATLIPKAASGLDAIKQSLMHLPWPRGLMRSSLLAGNGADGS
jgi:hypothetical protein